MEKVFRSFAYVTVTLPQCQKAQSEENGFEFYSNLYRSTLLILTQRNLCDVTTSCSSAELFSPYSSKFWLYGTFTVLFCPTSLCKPHFQQQQAAVFSKQALIKPPYTSLPAQHSDVKQTRPATIWWIKCNIKQLKSQTIFLRSCWRPKQSQKPSEVRATFIRWTQTRPQWNNVALCLIDEREKRQKWCIFNQSVSLFML